MSRPFCEPSDVRAGLVRPPERERVAPGRFPLLFDRLNGARLWQRRVRIDGCEFRACSLDRWIYLWRHKLRSAHPESAFFRGCLQPGMHVVDAGANVGLYTCLFARAVGGQGRVDAFEPDPRLHAALHDNARANGLTQVHTTCAALGAASGSACLHRSSVNSGDNRLRPIAALSTAARPHVPVKTLDACLQGRVVDFVKIDVQGCELEVLAGMIETLAANPSVQLYLEIWPFGLARLGATPADIFRFLADRGFEWTFPFGPSQGSATDFAQFTESPGWYCNVHARRRDVPARPR